MATFTKILSALALVMFAALAVNGRGSALAQTLPDHCRSPAPRSTFIYVDVTMVGVQSALWLQPILTGVRFLPNEPVHVIWFNPASGEGKQLFFDCFPGLTEAERRAQAQDLGAQITALFIGPASQMLLRDQRRFLAGIAQAADALSRAASGRSSVVANKAIAEFLANERYRFNESAGVPRVLLFSDMAQNSNLTAPLNNSDAEAEAAMAAHRIPNNFAFAEVYVYGVDPAMGGPLRPNSRDSVLETFWRSYFQTVNAQLKSFDRNLPLRRGDGDAIQESAQLTSWEGGIAHLSGGDQNRYAAIGMQMLVTSELKVEDAWLNLPGIGAVPFSGSLRCASNSECTFVGQIEGELAGALKKGDELEFSTRRSQLSGEIRLIGTDLLKVSDRVGLAPPSYDLALTLTLERLR